LKLHPEVTRIGVCSNAVINEKWIARIADCCECDVEVIENQVRCIEARRAEREIAQVFLSGAKQSEGVGSRDLVNCLKPSFCPTFWKQVVEERWKARTFVRSLFRIVSKAGQFDLPAVVIGKAKLARSQGFECANVPAIEKEIELIMASPHVRVNCIMCLARMESFQFRQQSVSLSECGGATLVCFAERVDQPANGLRGKRSVWLPSVGVEQLEDGLKR
jgi:hypothetical protein